VVRGVPPTSTWEAGKKFVPRILSVGNFVSAGIAGIELILGLGYAVKAFPDKAMMCGLPAILSTIANVPVRTPACFGAKMTPM
jgi:hypothetical protein